ncbi:MAG TPA: alpha-glucan family phosphorylase [Longimicrobiales bacterium]|nr:alpha-glucan family phosphorylase [Longimicrobiales bacterium]
MTSAAPTRPLDLPPPLGPLVPLAYNLRWSWHAPARTLFERLDAALWDATRHNPVRLLAEIDAERARAAAADAAYVAAVEAEAAGLQHYLSDTDTAFTRRGGPADLRVAYFCAEFAITECLPVFAGGLGVLAGDHLKSASDLGVPLVGVGLFYREGYFQQEVGRDGVQREAYPAADPTRVPLTLARAADGAPLRVALPFRDYHLHVQAWRADVGRVPLLLLDTDLPENRPEDRRITDRLYGGDVEQRLRQEVVLGVGGVRVLAALGFHPTVLHLNEGHAAFAAVELARVEAASPGPGPLATAERLAERVVFTTHTPVPAGHDYFAAELLERYLGGYVWDMREPWDRFLALGRSHGAKPQEPFCMTILALRLSGYRNGVSRLHGEVTRDMWRHLWPSVEPEDAPVAHITNGVHLPTWVAEEMAALYARHIGDVWPMELDEVRWQRAAHIPPEEVWRARAAQRARLTAEVRRRLAAQLARRGEDPAWTSQALDPQTLTIVFARRFATYKRAGLLLMRPARLEALLRAGKVQFVFAGKAHPRDDAGKEMLRRVHAFAQRPEFRTRFVYLEGYDVELARHLVAGADIWLNVPVRPREASGTSGMKAAANGALNLSVPDGWWAEALTDHNRMPESVGWSIEGRPGPDGDLDLADADALFALLEREIVPLFYDRGIPGGDVAAGAAPAASPEANRAPDATRALPIHWLGRVRASVRQLVPVFNTHRMVTQYLELAYLPAHSRWGTVERSSSIAEA